MLLLLGSAFSIIVYGADIESASFGTHTEAFAKKLAEFRNAVVHDVTNVDVNLVRYVSKLDQDKQTSFVDSCRFAFGPGFETDEITGLAPKGALNKQSVR